LFAHRAYVALRGLPAITGELADHALIGRAEHAEQTRAVLGFDPRFGFRYSDLGLLAALRAGLGVGYCQIGVGRRDPDLIPVLPGLVLARIGVWLAMHEDLGASRRVRVLFDRLAKELIEYVAGAA
jgi:DNA-binding transcriptional LysR family regulator